MHWNTLPLSTHAAWVLYLICSMWFLSLEISRSCDLVSLLSASSVIRTQTVLKINASRNSKLLMWMLRTTQRCRTKKLRSVCKAVHVDMPRTGPGQGKGHRTLPGVVSMETVDKWGSVSTTWKGKWLVRIFSFCTLQCKTAVATTNITKSAYQWQNLLEDLVPPIRNFSGWWSSQNHFQHLSTITEEC